MKKIFITGHKGMVGSAILSKLKNNNFKIVTADKKKNKSSRSKVCFKFF